MDYIKKIIDNLKLYKTAKDDDIKILIENNNRNNYLYKTADEVRRNNYGIYVYTRGLIEFSNYCKNDCFYCGIRKSNSFVSRYSLSKNEILDCCHEGYSLDFRTFVLQSGEDLHYSNDLLCDIISSVRHNFKDCAITLSVGEKSYKSYKAYFSTGANGYLLRHETAENEHYSKLHPKEMNLDNRKECLFNLKKIGYQVGSGFMVGSPYQTTENLIADLRFLQELMPDMIGIGPYITHNETPFAKFKNGTLELTLKMISILRLMFPYALISATTALGTINLQGREL